MSQSADDLPRLLSDIAAELPPYATTQDTLSHPRFAIARNRYRRTMIELLRYGHGPAAPDA
jgi:hypothetical protein